MDLRKELEISVFSFEGFKKHSSIAQSVERMTVNHDVVGSSPTGGGNLSNTCIMQVVLL